MKTLLLSLDGLSSDDYDSLKRLTPSLAALSSKLTCHELDAKVLTAPQAIWGEILTGQRWFANGCVGYSQPASSLNRVLVADEKTLLEPVRITRTDQIDEPTIIVNVPLLRPKPDRIWLSDGSLPINKRVSPSELSAQPPLSEYMDRPATSSIVQFEQSVRFLQETFLSAESKRLECVSWLMANKPWSSCIHRIGLFDHLAHLLGLNFLRARDLRIFGELEKFCQQLDDFITSVQADSDIELSIVSGYSHVPCCGIVNLNHVLAQGGFLEIDSGMAQTRVDSNRADAFSFGMQNPVSGVLLTSLEGRLKADATQAASPVAGSVFINSARTYKDGCVDESNYRTVGEEVREWLGRALSNIRAGAFEIEQNPIFNPGKNVAAFVIHGEGVEFHNMRESLGGRGTPRTTHSTRGVVLLPKGRCSKTVVTPAELNQLVWPN
jgi:predicted AlkP superfamily phosphohydrolase/phosphomutase